jgi:hypothetical protein
MKNKDNHDAIVSVMNSVPNGSYLLEKGSDRQKARPPKNNNNINLFKNLLKDIKDIISKKGSIDKS